MLMRTLATSRTAFSTEHNHLKDAMDYTKMCFLDGIADLGCRSQQVAKSVASKMTSLVLDFQVQVDDIDSLAPDEQASKYYNVIVGLHGDHHDDVATFAEVCVHADPSEFEGEEHVPYLNMASKFLEILSTCG